MATKLGLYELLAPQFLAGLPLPDYIDEYLSILGIEELHTALDAAAVVYTGIVTPGGDAAALPHMEHRAPTGEVFRWQDTQIRFRLTIPRAPISGWLNAQLVQLAAAGGNLANPALPAGVQADGNALLNMSDLLGSRLQPSTAAVPPATATTDAPQFAFRLELMLTEVAFHLGPSWRPAVYQGYRVIFDPADPKGDVRFVLPQVTLVYQQGPTPGQAPQFFLKSWGAGFDAPADLLAGELVRMVPPLAIHESGRIGFGIDKLLLDLSADSTPPEILQHFGTDAEWTGLYIRSLRVYCSISAADLDFTLSVRDALISFTGEVSLEARLDVVNAETFSMQVLLFEGDRPVDFDPGEPSPVAADVVPGRAQVRGGAYVQVIPIGGVPDFTVDVIYGSPQGDVALPWVNGQAQLPDDLGGEGPLSIQLQDHSSPTPKQIFQKIWISSPPASVLPPGSSRRQPAAWSQTSAPPGAGVSFSPSASGVRETLQLHASEHNIARDGASVTITQQGTNAIVLDSVVHSPFVGVDVPDDAHYDVAIELAAPPSGPPESEYFDLFYSYERPRELDFPAVIADYLVDFAGSAAQRVDQSYLTTPPPKPAGLLPDAAQPSDGPPAPGLTGTRALHAWLRHRLQELNGERQVTVDAYASYEGDPAKRLYNQRLSERRLAVAYAAIDRYNELFPGEPAVIDNRQDLGVADEVDDVAHGQDEAAENHELHTKTPRTDPSPYPPGMPAVKPRLANSGDRAVLISGIVRSAPPAQPGTITGILERGPLLAQPAPPAPASPPPAPPAPSKPGVFRRIGGRVRVERNVPVLFEIDGQLDFETAVEASMRQSQAKINGSSAPNQPFIFNNPEDGYVDFTLRVTYDTATRYLSEMLRLHSGAGDVDGLVQIDNTDPNAGAYRWRNALGAMMVLSPILAKGLGESDLGSGGGWAKIGVSWGVPALIGGLNILISEKLTLYGGELLLRQYDPTGAVAFTDAAVMFDYGVAFQIDCLGVKTSRPLRVRYKSVGFAVDATSGTYQPVFDPSKGYEIDLSDPGLFDVDGVLGDLIRVLGARIARFNPVTLEVDLGFVLDLGVVKFDQFKVKWPLAYPEEDPDPGPGLPMILPAGARVDIPGTLQGSGRLHILDDGFEGSLDLTLVPVKVRIAAALAVRQLTQDGETVTAVLVTLGVEFPTPIVLGATGLGIFGFLGLFAMHYKRLEPQPAPGDAVGPALGWLQKAGGDPTKLHANDNPNDPLWVPAMDRWSFGVGAVLGSLDGGFLTNLRGMVMLELPGPRLLICVKMTVLTELPGTKDDFDKAGVLGVLDLDFNLKQITLGVIFEFTEVKELIEIKLAIELYFSWDDPAKWHLYFGTVQQPATAEILGICRGGGYFMIAGDEIKDFPVGETKKITLPGVAVAVGIFASMVWGSKPVGLYLEVAARADLGVAFSPFFMIGAFKLKGGLHLWIVSIEASAALTISASETTAYFEGEVCGRVDLFFFEVEGCVDVSVGNEPKVGGYPELIQGLYLQSFAPVLTSGQGGERPIDASLGNAIAAGPNDPPPAVGQMLRVPIDSVPVLQFMCSPLVGVAGEVWDEPMVATTTFTQPLALATGLGKDPKGYVLLGNQTVRFRLKEIALFSRPAGSVAPFTQVSYPVKDLPPAVWRRDPKAGNDTANARIDLALGSRTPSSAPYALERSSELETIVEETWKNICEPVAPPAEVLFTACGRAIGTSKHGQGWVLDGIAQPDPPGTIRNAPPPTELHVGEPALTADEKVIRDLAELAGDECFLRPQVVGQAPKSLQDLAAFRCRRGVQIPRLLPALPPGEGIDIGAKPPGYVAALQSLRERLWITLNTGPATQIRLLLLADKNWREGQFELRQLDAMGALLAAQPLHKMPHVVLASYSNLPATWNDPGSPWAADTAVIFNYLGDGKPEFKFMERLLVTFAPLAACAAIQLRALPGSMSYKESTLVLGAVEVRSLTEVQRAKYDESSQTSKQKTLKDYLDLGEAVPLLAPDREYRVDVTYAANALLKIEVGFGLDPLELPTASADVKRSYYFRTDAELPARLDPWVLGTAPNGDEDFHFYGEPVIVAFNDRSALWMIDAYGGKVQFAVRGADGRPVDPPDFDEQGNPVNLAPAEAYDVSSFLGIEDAPFASPYYDTVLATLGEVAPCVPASGSGKKKDVLTLKAKLAPQMAYTFDLRAVPKDPNAEVKIAEVTGARGDLPFFRRAFRTGRYRDPGELAADVRRAKITHRALDGAIDLPGSGPVSDAEMAAALTAAGEQALPAAQENRVTVYWVAGKPHAILLDTVEPHWRARAEPKLVPVPQADGQIGDPNFRVIQDDRVPSLELESVDDRVERFVYAAGGARTLAFLDPAQVPAPGAPPVAAGIGLKRPASALYDLQQEKHELVSIPLSGSAPWDEVADDE